MLRKLGLILSTTLLAIATFAFSAHPAMAATVNVDMGAAGGPPLVFKPNVVTIAPGDTIHFKSAVLGPHNVIFDSVPGGINKDAISYKKYAMTGASFDIKFPDDAPAGTYKYYCTPHRGAGMFGTVMVK